MRAFLSVLHIESKSFESLFFLILTQGRESRGGEGEKEKERESHWLVASHTCPNQESKAQHFGLWNNTNQLRHLARVWVTFWLSYLCPYFPHGMKICTLDTELVQHFSRNFFQAINTHSANFYACFPQQQILVVHCMKFILSVPVLFCIHSNFILVPMNGTVFLKTLYVVNTT